MTINLARCSLPSPQLRDLLRHLLRHAAARVLIAGAALLALTAVTAFAAHATSPPLASESVLLVYGDSLSAAYGIKPDQGYVALLQSKLKAAKRPWRVVNASVSGETSAGGRSRLASELSRHKPSVVILQLGANDGLRGLPIKELRNNLTIMLQLITAAGAEPVLVGMRMPPNLGPYAKQFFQTYESLAASQQLAYVPFMLEPLMTDANAFQADQLHPTAAAQPALFEHLWPAIEQALAATHAQRLKTRP